MKTRIRAQRVLPFKPIEPPLPSTCRVAYHDTLTGRHTTIARTWEEGENARYCGRCPIDVCRVTEGHCMVTFLYYIPTHEATTYTWPNKPGPARPKLVKLDTN